MNGLTLEVTKVAIKLPKPDRKRQEEKAESWMQGLGILKEMIDKSLTLKSSLYDALSKNATGFCDTRPAEGWGDMTMRKGDLKAHERRHSFRHRYSYVGPFRYPHRALLPISDGRAWHHRVSGLGGTVLIDGSRSMSLTLEQLLEMLKKHPLATVAVYHSTNGCQSGETVIIALGNRYDPACGGFGDGHTWEGGNVVDGPALRWLSKQERPRVWVSDGGITGRDDRLANSAMITDCVLTLARGGIKMVRTPRQVAGAMAAPEQEKWI